MGGVDVDVVVGFDDVVRDDVGLDVDFDVVVVPLLSIVLSTSLQVLPALPVPFSFFFPFNSPSLSPWAWPSRLTGFQTLAIPRRSWNVR